MLCPNCAATLSDTANFCSNCGTNVIPMQGASPYAAAAAAEPEPKAAAQPKADASPFEKGYQKGYDWATGGNTAQSDWTQDTHTYQQPAAPYAQPTSAYAGEGTKSKLVAGLLGIFLGSLGIHKFYLGYSREGLIMLLLTIFGSMLTFGLAAAAMEVIGIIEGIIYLVRPDSDFYYTYELGHKGWF